MTNVQLYFAIGLPSVLALVNLGVMLVLFTELGGRIQRLAERMDDMVGAIYELYKRLTRVEFKLGTQP